MNFTDPSDRLIAMQQVKALLGILREFHMVGEHYKMLLNDVDARCQQGAYDEYAWLVKELWPPQ
jgi:hypothetical protein